MRLGLRPALYAEILAERPRVDYFEAITENYLVPESRARRALERVRERYPVVLHGVGLNLLGHAPLDEAYLDAVCALADAIDAPYVTDHLCWTGAHGVTHHTLTWNVRDVGIIGDLRKSQIERARQAFDQSPGGDARVIVMHHNPVKGEISQRHGLVNTKRVLGAFAELGVELVLKSGDLTPLAAALRRAARTAGHASGG